MKARLRSVLFECLREAGKVLMKHYGRLRRIEHKGEIDLVTVADRESERVIIGIVHRAFPEHGVLAEESRLCRDRKRSEYLWIIDPLDGTTNYSHSFPVFSVSIALEILPRSAASAIFDLPRQTRGRDLRCGRLGDHASRGEIVMGGVYAPFQDELFYAEKGKGARLNGKRIRVSRTPHLKHSLLVTGFPYDRRANVDHYLEYLRRFLLASHGVLRVGSAALDLCSVACGRLDGFWEEKLFPWDTAAGMLIVYEAGGTVTDFHGAPFSPYGKEIVASNALIHAEMLNVLTPTPPTLSGPPASP